MSKQCIQIGNKSVDVPEMAIGLWGILKEKTPSQRQTFVNGQFQLCIKGDCGHCGHCGWCNIDFYGEHSE